MFLVIISNVISVGERLRNIHIYIQYSFYLLAFIITYVLILYPLKVIIFSPTFSVDALLKDDKKSFRLYKSAAKTLLKNDVLTEEDKLLIKGSINIKEKLQESLSIVFDRTIKKEINKVIISNSKSVLISTALSQNGNLDMLAVIFINLKMIKEIILLCGFRPSYANLAKLSLNVMVTSIVADGLEDFDLNELLPKRFSETLTDLPFIKTFSHSMLQGVSNGVLTCRVGIVTRKYLFNDNKALTKQDIRRTAYKESLKLMPLIVKEGLSIFPKGIKGLFVNPLKKFWEDYSSKF